MLTRRAARGHAARFVAAALGVIIPATAMISCAKIEAPPGAAPDLTPPQLVSTFPDSLAILPGFAGDVVFRFNEVISEGGSPSQGTGTGDLERLILLSPTNRPPEVSWHRDRITVRPREGWQPGRVYRVELLPGATDLRNNRSTGGSTIVTFTTGAARPALTLTGAAWDWPNSRAAPAALIEAVHAADSLVYRTVADSAGSFRLGPLPDGPYVVYAVIDQNRSGVRDPREAFDSVRIAAGRADVGTIWTFPHDTIGPRIQSITAIDSASAAVVLSQALDPYHPIAPGSARVRLLPDSTGVTVISLLSPTADDSAFSRRPTDSAAARPLRDTTAKAVTRTPAVPKLSRDTRPARPPVSERLVLRIAGRWQPGARYTVLIRGLRNLSGVAADGVGVLAIAAAPPATAAPASPPADSGARRTKPR